MKFGKWTVVAGAILAVGAGVLVGLPAEAKVSATEDLTAFGGSRVLVFENRNENVAPTTNGFAFNSPLYSANGVQVGTDSGFCIVLPPRDGITDETICETVISLTNGTITGSGKQRLTDTVAVGAVTGGTGQFKGCEGTITGELDPVTFFFKITVRLSEC